RAIINEFIDCPFFINALVTSGRYNLCLFFTATDLKRLEGIVNHHLRGNPKVKDIELNIVIQAAKDFVMPLNIDYDNERQSSCDQSCADCI
ncbi:AsnC family transcriptional regulator, partial [Candidatus Woesearchaeota archaeon CG11_big_fil_rev_8_21_14_0_20_43_8]